MAEGRTSYSKGSFAEPATLAKAIVGENATTAQLKRLALVCAALCLLCFLVALDTGLRAQVMTKIFGVERNVYEPALSWRARLLTWAPDPLLEVMPEIPVGASAQFVRRPVDSSTDWMFASTSGSELSKQLTAEAIAQSKGPFPCTRIAKNINQAISLEGRRYWYLWKGSMLVTSSDGGVSCTAMPMGQIATTQGLSKAIAQRAGVDPDEGYLTSLSTMSLPQPPPPPQSSRMRAAAVVAQPAESSVVALTRLGQVFVLQSPDTPSRAPYYQGLFLQGGVFKPQSIDLQLLQKPSKESLRVQQSSPQAPPQFTSGPPPTREDFNVAVATSNLESRLYRRLGYIQSVDGVLFGSVQARWPFPSHKLKETTTGLAPDRSSSRVSNTVIPSLTNPILGMAPLADSRTTLATFRITNALGTLVLWSMEDGLETVFEPRKDPASGTSPTSAPTKVTGLPSDHWYRSIAATGNGQHIYLAASPPEMNGKVHRPTIFYSSDGGLKFRILSEANSSPPSVPLGIAGGFLFAFVAFGAFQNIRFIEEDQKDARRTGNTSTSDEPIGLDGDDVIGVRKIALALSRVINNVGTSPPLAFGIAGSWGSGKSSLMLMLKEDLESRLGQVIWFNAWHHQSEEHILAALMEAVKTRAVPPVWTGSGFMFRIALLWHRRKRLLNFVVPYLSILFALFLVYYSDNAVSQRLDELTEDVSGIPSLFAKAVAGLPLLFGLYRVVKPFNVNPSAITSKATGFASVLGMEEKLSVRHNFQKEFRDVTEVMCRFGTDLIIIIDDLDRCSAKNVGMVLDAVSFLTSAGRCYIVLGYDRDRVMNLLEKNYVPTEMVEREDNSLSLKEDLPPRQIAENYLRKIINVEIKVPRFQNAMAEDLVRALTTSDTTDQTSKDEINKRKNRKKWLSWFDGLMGVAFIIALSSGLITAAVMLSQTSKSAGPVVAVVKTPQQTDASTDIESDTTKQTPVTKVDAPKTKPASKVENRLPALPQQPTVPSQELYNAFILLLSLVTSLALLFLIVYLARREERQLSAVEDTYDFTNALNEWVPLIRNSDATPRNVKQFINRTRLSAERLKVPDHVDGSPTLRSILPNDVLVTLSALDSVYSELVDQLASGQVNRMSHPEIAERYNKLNHDDILRAREVSIEHARLYRGLG